MKVDPKLTINPWVQEHKPGIYMVMGDTAEVVAKRYKIGREAQDEYALSSQQRTARAQQEGRYRRGAGADSGRSAPSSTNRAARSIGQENHLCDKDECNRPDTTLEGLLALKPYFDPNSGQGTVTAGQLVAALRRRLGHAPHGTAAGRRRWASSRRSPFAVSPWPAASPTRWASALSSPCPSCSKRFGLTVGDIDLWELNEAFAVQVIYCRDRLGIDPERLNVNGGSISIGHPFGMTGSRMVGTLANEMVRRKARYGVVTMCVGGGQGAAGLFELC